MSPSTTTIRPRRAPADFGGTERHPLSTQSNGYSKETELSKLIRYGCQFELEMHQMAELNRMQAENIKLRRKLEDDAAGWEGELPVAALLLHR